MGTTPDWVEISSAKNKKSQVRKIIRLPRILRRSLHDVWSFLIIFHKCPMFLKLATTINCFHPERHFLLKHWILDRFSDRQGGQKHSLERPFGPKSSKRA